MREWVGVGVGVVVVGGQEQMGEQSFALHMTLFDGDDITLCRQGTAQQGLLVIWSDVDPGQWAL